MRSKRASGSRRSEEARGRRHKHVLAHRASGPGASLEGCSAVTGAAAQCSVIQRWVLIGVSGRALYGEPALAMSIASFWSLEPAASDEEPFSGG